MEEERGGWRDVPGGGFCFEGPIKRLVQRIRFHSGHDLDSSGGRLGLVLGRAQ